MSLGATDVDEMCPKFATPMRVIGVAPWVVVTAANWGVLKAL
jgi:hypothetical protein